jgi:hypothetical protein
MDSLVFQTPQGPRFLINLKLKQTSFTPTSRVPINSIYYCVFSDFVEEMDWIKKRIIEGGFHVFEEDWQGKDFILYYKQTVLLREKNES